MKYRIGNALLIRLRGIHVNLIGVEDLQHVLMLLDFFVLDASGGLQFFLGFFFLAEARIGKTQIIVSFSGFRIGADRLFKQRPGLLAERPSGSSG